MHPSEGGHASYDRLLSTKPFFTVVILPYNFSTKVNSLTDPEGPTP